MPARPVSPDSHGGERTVRVAFFLALALFVGGMLIATGYALWRSKTETINHSFAIAAMHSRSFEDHLTQSLRMIELTLTSALPPEAVANPRERERFFEQTLRHAPFLRSLSLLDDSGKIIASSNRANLGRVVPTAGYLPEVAADTQILRIGAPWAGRDFADGRPATPDNPVGAEEPGFLPIVRATPARQGTATLVAAINPDYFVFQLLQKLPSHEGHVVVVRYDDTLLLSSDPNKHPGSLEPQLTELIAKGDVEFGQRQVDRSGGEAELQAFRASRLYPIVVITALDRAQALKLWHDETKLLLSVDIPVLLAIVLLAFAFYRRQLQLAAQRAEAARLTRLNATVFESSSDSIIITDPEARIISVNPAFERICGYRAEEVLGQNPRLLSSGVHDAGFYEAMWQQILAEGFWQGEMVNRRKDGQLFTALNTITAFRAPEGRLLHYIGVASDITARKRHDAEVAELQRALEKRAHEAEAANRAKSTFLANMSHELRTPMNAIMGMTDLALRRATDPKQREQLDKVQHAAHNLLAKISDILDITNLEANRLYLEQTTFTLADVLATLEAKMRPLARDKGLDLGIDIAPALARQPLQGDALRLGQILLKLAGNAVKFTSNGSVSIRLHQVSETPTAILLRCEIRDTGIGISPADQQRLFTAFEQADGSLTRAHGGTGLGLYISKRLAEMMGGGMGVESVAGEGSTFWFTCLLDKVADHHDEAEGGQSAGVASD